MGVGRPGVPLAGTSGETRGAEASKVGRGGGTVSVGGGEGRGLGVSVAGTAVGRAWGCAVGGGAVGGGTVGRGTAVLVASGVGRA